MMTDLSTETRLQLLQQIRSRNKEDRYDMYRREKILYGRGFSALDGVGVPYEYTEGGMTPSSASFRGRFLVAVLLFVLVAGFDQNGIKIAGITSDRVFEMISADYEPVLRAWVAETWGPAAGSDTKSDRTEDDILDPDLSFENKVQNVRRDG